VNAGEIKHEDEYDSALSQSKAMALDSASLANRKEFMMLYLENEQVR
jgi:hypothetical protein